MSQKNIYEIGMLINPDLSQQEAEEVVKEIKGILESKGASVLSEGEIVNIELAYQIITKIKSKNERFDEAHFVWVKFEAEPGSISEIKREVDKIKEKVFRYLITKTVADDELTGSLTFAEEEEEEEDLSDYEDEYIDPVEKLEGKKSLEDIDKAVEEKQKEVENKEEVEEIKEEK